ncbi:MAG: hypothetical protein KDG89_16885 [Geminicoccaceae bacterium]|nr:hypothetical protein [Geminicoccaceae bacterium]
MPALCLPAFLAALLPLAACGAAEKPAEPPPLVLYAPGSRGLLPTATARLPGLDDAARVLLSYYAALYNTGCAEGSCGLGVALGIDDQCGTRHIRRIQRLMPDFDPARCVYLPDQASAYTRIEAMTLKKTEPDAYEVTIGSRWKDGGEGGVDPLLVERWRLDEGRLVRAG